MLTNVAVVVCALLAVNVGGNNSAAEMAPAYGAGVRSKREAAVLASVFALLGAVCAGSPVVGTLSSGGLLGHSLEGNVSGAIVIVISATVMIALANLFRLPVATAHAMVGAVVGFGLAKNCLNWSKLVVIVGWWILTPIAAFALSYFAAKWLLPRLLEFKSESEPKGAQAALGLFLTFTGCYLAFSAGSNGLAKAVAPLVGAQVMTMDQAALLGGIGMAVGAAVIGPHLLQILGTEITPLSLPKAVMLELVCGSILMCASLAGIPVSLAEIVTCSVIGISCAHTSVKETCCNLHVGRIVKLWLVCPVYTATLSYLLSAGWA